MRRGDIWLINLDPTVGAEIKKTLNLSVLGIRAGSSTSICLEPQGR